MYRRNPTIALLTLALAACASTPAEPAGRANVSDAQGTALGALDLIPQNGTTRLRGRLQGLPPGVHAIHVHEAGVCVAPFTSAGGHFNPAHVPHGLQTPAGGHAGDLPNIQVSAAGSVDIDVVVRAPLRGTGGILDADGAAIVVHAAADDERTDPAGNAGARIACGVVYQ
jgi:Cu-Zn family superoxide dismutase